MLDHPLQIGNIKKIQRPPLAPPFIFCLKRELKLLADHHDNFIRSLQH